MTKKSKTDLALANIRERMVPLQAELTALAFAEQALLDALDPVAADPKRTRRTGTPKAKDAAAAAEAGAQS